MGLTACVCEPPAGHEDARRAIGIGPLLVIVYKAPACGRCVPGVELKCAVGFAVEVRDTRDLGTFKAEFAVPVDHGSCHAATVGATSLRDMYRRTE